MFFFFFEILKFSHLNSNLDYFLDFLTFQIFQCDHVFTNWAGSYETIAFV